MAEIGSRSLRFLVADVSSEGGLSPIVTRSAQTHLMASVRQGSKPTAAALNQIQVMVAEFRTQAKELGAQHIQVFGTKALRSISEDTSVDVSRLTSGVRILTESEEALCSLSASIWGLPRLAETYAAIFLIDQGGGSLELAAGKLGPPLEMLGSESLDLGSDRLLQQFKLLKLDVALFRSWFEDRLRPVAYPPVDGARIVVQGSVATKCAWLAVRRSQTERYEPKRIQGREMAVRSLHQMLSYVERFPPTAWGPVRASLEPENPNSEEFERLITGSIALVAILQQLGADEFTVSGYGTRYGVAWQLAKGEGFQITDTGYLQ